VRVQRLTAQYTTQPAFAEVLCFELSKCSFQLFFNHDILKSPPHQNQLEFQKDEQEIQTELTNFTSLLDTFLVLKTFYFYCNFIPFFPKPYYLRYLNHLIQIISRFHIVIIIATISHLKFRYFYPYTSTLTLTYLSPMAHY
jgi:hypothetical protein